MSESNEAAPAAPQDDPATAAASPVPPPPVPVAPAPPAYVHPGGTAPVGTIRSTGTCILLTIVTLGFYTWYWYYKTHEEMKQHSGTGLGGGLALVRAIFVGIAMPFLTPNEVGGLYERRGQPKPVSAATGLWALLLGWFFFVGLIVWFVKTNGALNAYWRSVGAQG
jgi:Domain of unknown function (DUF4234)